MCACTREQMQYRLCSFLHTVELICIVGIHIEIVDLQPQFSVSVGFFCVHSDN